MLLQIPARVAGLLVPVALALAMMSLPAAANSVVVPSGFEDVDGGVSNSIPLSGFVFGRYQQVYESQAFPGGAIEIRQIRFRRDVDQPGPLSNTFGDVTIRLSTTPLGADSLSQTFADNAGSDVTVVRSGPLTLESESSGGNPAPFDVAIVLSVPFLYDPAAGNLLFDWTNEGGDSFGEIFFDATRDTSDAVSRVLGVRGSATGSSLDTLGLVTQFVPEPRTGLLIALGLLALAVPTRRLGYPHRCASESSQKVTAEPLTSSLVMDRGRGECRNGESDREGRDRYRREFRHRAVDGETVRERGRAGRPRLASSGQAGRGRR